MRNHSGKVCRKNDFQEMILILSKTIKKNSMYAMTDMCLVPCLGKKTLTVSVQGPKCDRAIIRKGRALSQLDLVSVEVNADLRDSGPVRFSAH